MGDASGIHEFESHQARQRSLNSDEVIRVYFPGFNSRDLEYEIGVPLSDGNPYQDDRFVSSL